MATYGIRVLRGGQPVAGVEVVGSDILYSAATGVDGRASVAISGRSSPIALQLVLVKAAVGLPWLSIAAGTPVADRERRTVGGHTIAQSAESSRRRRTTQQEQIDTGGDLTTWEDGYGYADEEEPYRYGRANPAYVPGFQFGGGVFVLRADTLLDIEVA